MAFFFRRLVCLALASPADGSQVPTKYIAGVPVYNAEVVSELGAASSASSGDEVEKPEWIVVMKQERNDVMGVHAAGTQRDLCSSSGTACISHGNPERGGIAFATVKASEAELEAIVQKNPGEVEFIEADVPIYLSPDEDLEDSESPPFPDEDPEASAYDMDLISLANGRRDNYGPPGSKGTCFFAYDCGLRVWGPRPDGSQFATELRKTGLYPRGVVTIRTKRAVGEKLVSNGNGAPGDRIAHGFSPENVRLITEMWEKGGCGPAPPPPPPAQRRRHAGFEATTTTTMYAAGFLPPSVKCTTTTTTNHCKRASSQPTDRWGLDRIDTPFSADGLDSMLDGKYSSPVSYGRVLDGKGVHVYVVDTGINAQHEDFGGRVIPTIETGSGRVKVCRPNDMSCARDVDGSGGHGTHCAGTVGGKKSGVAKAVTLHSCGVFAESLTSTKRIVLAIDWITAFGVKPSVISMSLGSALGFKSQSMRRSIDKATQSGVTVVVAAGNVRLKRQSFDACDYSPPDIESTITVGALLESGSRAGFSALGPCLDIFAPGAHILSATNRNNRDFLNMSGTSMAAPHVAGAAALLLQMDPSMKAADIKKTLQKHATKEHIFGEGYNKRIPNVTTPNLALFLTCFSTTTTTPIPVRSSRRRGSQRRRRRRSGKGARRRRRRSSRQ